MADIITYSKLKDFLRANSDYIYSDYFGHYHLIGKVEDLKKRKVEAYECYNIVDSNGSNVLCMWLTIGYYIYANKWTDDIVDLLVNKVELHKFKHSAFCGRRKLVKELFEKSNIEGNVFKNRFIESCTEVLPLKKQPVGQGQNVSLEDFNELVQMGIDYNQEEFQGKGSATRDSIASSLVKAIETNSVFTWRENGIIVCMAHKINDDDEHALIGSLYTKPKFRGKGYAYFLMHAVTSGLLGVGYKKCGLVSDADNVITQKIFSRIGYKAIYDWVLMRKE